MPTAPVDRRTPFWLWWLLVGFVGLMVWSAVDFNRRMMRHSAEMARLGAAGTAPGDAWLGLARTDPVAAHAAATAGFRARVPADRLVAVVRATPALTDPATQLTVRSFGGGRVTQTLFGLANDAPPRLVLAGPGGLTLELIEENGAVKLDAVRLSGADPFAGN